MFVTTGVLTAALAVLPSFSAAVTLRTGVEEKAGVAYAEELTAELVRLGDVFPGRLVSPRTLLVVLKAANFGDTAECKGAIDCAALLGKTGNLDRLIALQMVKVGAELVVEATLIEVLGGKAVASAKSTMPFKRPEMALKRLAAELARKAPAWVPPADAIPPPPPVPEAVGTPPETVPAQPFVAAPSESVSTTPAAAGEPPGWTPVFVAGGATVVTGVAAGVFGGLGFAVKQNVASSVGPNGISSLTPSQYNQQRSDGNTKFTIAAACAGGAVAFAVLTVILYKIHGSSAP